MAILAQKTLERIPKQNNVPHMDISQLYYQKKEETDFEVMLKSMTKPVRRDNLERRFPIHPLPISTNILSRVYIKS